jgi:hypothetical protein
MPRFHWHTFTPETVELDADSCGRRWRSAAFQFVSSSDSPLEEGGFEPSVPRDTKGFESDLCLIPRQQLFPRGAVRVLRDETSLHARITDRVAPGVVYTTKA